MRSILGRPTSRRPTKKAEPLRGYAYLDGKHFWSIYGDKVPPATTWWAIENSKIIKMHEEMFSRGDWTEFLRGLKDEFENDPRRKIYSDHERY